MRRAVKMWETSKYWEQRAAGAIQHAKYKELPAVRARRIKGLEADLRSRIASFTPHANVPAIMQRHWDAPPDAQPIPHVWVGPKGRGGYWTPAESLPRVEASQQRWLRHIENRLLYERAMLSEAGAAHLLDKAPRPKQPPLCNYRIPEGLDIKNEWHRGEMLHYAQVEMTKAEYARIYSDYKGTRVVGNSHRVRIAIIKHARVCVFLTDSKVHERPDDVPKAAPVIRERIEPRPYVAPKPTPFDAMKQQLREGGVQVVSAPQLFPTPPDLAARMVEAACIEPGDSVLEPSAGTGNILRAIGNAPDKVAVEVSPQLVEMLARCGVSGLRVLQADFLECNGDLGKFDRIVMNPPFERGSDIKHIKHAMGFLKPGGRLVALCANGPRQNEQLKPLASEWEDLPADTFKEAGTSARAAMLVIDKE
jgi:SAM-dependent methyltransferase